MKLQKIVFIVSAIIVAILLILLMLSNCKYENLLIGILSSTIVVGTFAFVQYLHEKNRVIFITYKISKHLFIKILGINKLLLEVDTITNLQAIRQLIKEATECGVTLDINEYSPFYRRGKILYVITRLYSIYNRDLRDLEYKINNYLIYTCEIAVENKTNEINRNNKIITVHQSLSYLMEIINYNMRHLDKLTKSNRWTEVHDQWMNQNQTVNTNKNHSKMKKNQTCSGELNNKYATNISIIAIVVSVIAIVVATIAIVNITPFQVSHEGYIGFIVSLIGILVTFAVAYQIYNAVELKESVKEFKAIKEELEGYKREFTIYKSDSEIMIYSLKAESYNHSYRTPRAILEAFNGLLPSLHLMEHEDKEILKDIDIIFRNVKTYKDRLSLDQFESQNGCRADSISEFKTEIEGIKKRLQEHKFYIFIEERFEKVINLINEKIEECRRTK